MSHHMKHIRLPLGVCLMMVSLWGCQRENDVDYHAFEDHVPAAIAPATSSQKPDASQPAASAAADPQVGATNLPDDSPAVAAVLPTTQNDNSTSPPIEPVSTSPGTPLESVNPPAENSPQTATQAPATNSQPGPVRELELALPPAPPASVSLASMPPSGIPQPTRKMELLIPEKDFRVEGPEAAIRVSFDDIDLLKVLNADPVPLDVEQHLPAWLSGLNGKMIRIRGWMYPPNQETELPGFLFVRDNQICCFGRKPMVYDKFGVRLREGVTTDYIQGRPFDVVGKMIVKSKILNDELFWLYQIEDAIIIDH